MHHCLHMESDHSPQPHRAPSSEPSLPRRDSVEDADSTLTRKRPRLDNGEGAGNTSIDVLLEPDREPSAERPSTPPNSNQPALHEHDNPSALISPRPPSRVTINLRTQPPKVAEEPPAMAASLGHENGIAEASDMMGRASPNDEDGSAQAAAADSTPVSPLIEVVSEGMDEDTEQQVVEIEDDSDEILVDVFETLPFLDRFGSKDGVIEAILTHVQDESAPLDLTALLHLSSWIDRIPHTKAVWLPLFSENTGFWDQFGNVMVKLLQRRVLSDQPRPSDIPPLRHLLMSFIRVLIRLVSIDIENLEGLAETYTQPTRQSFHCIKHLRAMRDIFKPESPLFDLLDRVYRIDVEDLRSQLSDLFAAASLNGLPCLVKFGCLGLAQGKLSPVAMSSTFRIIGQVATRISRPSSPISVSKLLALSEVVYSAFQVLNSELQDVSKVLPVEVSRDLVLYGSQILHSACIMDPSRAQALSEEILGDSPQFQESPHLPALIANCWKFKLFKKYISKGRMELRVTCMTQLDADLVGVWQDYKTYGSDHPVMQYIAGFLIDEQVIDYIVGVDSHPQLIARAGNIIGFLIMTNRYTDQQADTIWQTVKNSPDPRVVAATLHMLKHLINLMGNTQAILHVVEQVRELPVDAFTVETLTLVRDLCTKLCSMRVDWLHLPEKNSPYALLLELIQDAYPGTSSTALTNNIYAEARDMIKQFSRVTPAPQRAKMFGHCVEAIKNQTEEASACVEAMTILARPGIQEDAEMLINQLELARHFIPEICTFVQRESQQPPTLFQHNGLFFRLDLLTYVVLHNPSSIPDEHYTDLWEHLVGPKAINNTMRDLAWQKFRQLVQRSPTNLFIARLLELVPSLPPPFFTMGFYDFIHDTTGDSMRRRQTLWEVEGEVLKVPGSDELWRIILTAPSGTIEKAAAHLLACRYLDVYEFPEVTLDIVEATHVALVRRCVDQLLTSFATIRSSVSEVSDMEGSAPAKSFYMEELCFTRTLLFMGVFVELIRTRPKFSPFPRHDSKVSLVDESPINGEPMIIQYQAHDGSVAGQKTAMTVGQDDTLQELKDRLARATGFSEFRVIGGGLPLDLESGPTVRLKEIEHKIKWLLVKRAPGSEQRKVEDQHMRCSRFESEVMAHFDEIYAFMDGEDSISEATFNFLQTFPPPDSASDAVMSESFAAVDVFPPGKAFRARYACRALDARLKDLLSKGITNDGFLARCVRLLEAALTDEQFLSQELERKHEPDLASLFIETLLVFLKERPSKEISLAYFSNEERLVARLVSFLQTMLGRPDMRQAVCDCYSTIIEAALHSPRIWEVFTTRQDFRELHLELLLRDPRPLLRVGVARSIEALCGDLPITCSLTPEEICARFWSVISSILSETLRYPKQSSELFDLAELVFVKFDDKADRDENMLRGLLTSWSSILVNYKHEEFVGRDEVDNVVLGFTKLLHSCVRSLKSFKKPLNSSALMQKLFNTFLFVAPTEESETQDSLPVLESNSRKALYELVLTLCEDSDAHEQLVHLLGGLGIDDTPFSTFAFDRANEIRSPTGYVGLYNPRNICYMNSLLTQLFMNREFRRFMLSMPVSDADKSQQLLVQTQKLFAEMQESYAKAADPRDFAKCVRGLDNQPIDINIQMDADEFYNLLFDQWEAQMLRDDAKRQFRSFYGGHTVNQIKSKECQHVSERVESFFVVQCDVKGKANLQESLQAFVEGDVMEGDNKYKCESCDGRLVDAVKRTCLKDVPDNLIFHLKRFDFDLTNMTRCKIDDLFEFPEKIDVAPYKVDHLNNPEVPSVPDVFQLVGVLIHQGTADGGHYYSFIRERPSRSQEAPVWFDFNDREVSDMQAHQISSMSFGGWYEDQFHGGPKQKSFNAYMLFYQRTSAMASEQQQFAQAPSSGPPKVPVPDELSREVASQNEQIIRSHCLFDENHSAFVRQVLEHQRTVSNGTCSEDHRSEKATIFVVMEHIRQVISRTRDLPELDTLNSALKRRIQGCNTCCKMFLDYFAHTEAAVEDLLLRCPYSRMRATIRTLILEALMTLRHKDSALYGVDVNLEVLDSEDLRVSDNGALSTVIAVLSLVVRHRLTGHTRSWDDIFDVLLVISTWGIHEVALILAQGFLHACLAILALTPATKAQYPVLARSADRKRPIYNKLIQLMLSLLSRIDLNAAPEEPEYRVEGYDPRSRQFPLTSDELGELQYWDEQERSYSVVSRMIDLWTVTPGSPTAFLPGDILTLILRSQSRWLKLEGIFTTLKCSIIEYSPEYIDPFVRAGLYFCRACQDPHYVQDLISTVVTVAKKLQHHAGEEVIHFFTELYQATYANQSRLDALSPDSVYDTLARCSPLYGPTLLVYDDERVRRQTMGLLLHIFCNRAAIEPELSPSSHKIRFTMMRRLIAHVVKKLKYEHESDTPRHYIDAAVHLLEQLLQTMVTFAQSEEDDMEEYRRPDDLEFAEKHREDLRILLASWPEEDANILSAGDYAEGSEYDDSEDDNSYLP